MTPLIDDTESPPQRSLDGSALRWHELRLVRRLPPSAEGVIINWVGGFERGAVTNDIDGLWTVEFGSSEGISGGGVVVFQDGKIAGGDATHFYLGEYTLDGGKLKATLRVSPFIAGAQSVFRTVGRDHNLDLIGSLVSEEQAIAQGTVREAPQLVFGAKLTRRGLISGTGSQ